MESAVAILTCYEDNARWVSGCYEALKKEFNNQWVAVLDKKVIDHHSDLKKLVKQLRKQHLTAYNQIAVEYVTTNKLNFVFQ
jgi:hypothetical protein